MKKSIVTNKWEYDIIEKPGQYGYTLLIYKNNELIYQQGGFGSVGTAEVSARDYFLSSEFNIDPEYPEY